MMRRSLRTRSQTPVIAEMVPPIIKGEDNEIPPASVVDERRQVEIGHHIHAAIVRRLWAFGRS